MNLIPLVRYNAPTDYLSKEEHCDLIYCSYLIKNNLIDERFFKIYKKEYKMYLKKCKRVNYLPIQYKLNYIRKRIRLPYGEIEKRYTNLMEPFNALTRNNKYMFIVLYLFGNYLDKHVKEYFINKEGYDENNEDDEGYLEFITIIAYNIIVVYEDTDYETKIKIRKDIQNFMDLQFDGLYSYNYSEFGTDDNYLNVYSGDIDNYIDDIDYSNIIGNGDEDSRYLFSG
jgi:hypothetical protein